MRIGVALFCKHLPEPPVDAWHGFPHAQIPLLQLCYAFYVEALEQFAYGFFLLVVDVVEACELFEVGYVDEQFLCIDHGGVDVVEVAQQHFAP